MDDFLEFFRLDAVVSHDYTEHRTIRRNRKRVERWKREKWLGRGAYGKVWLETAHKSKARAVKEVDKHIHMDHLKEIRAIAKFSKYSGRFAEFYGWYDNAFSYFLAMEYFPHGTLDDCIKAVPGPMTELDTRQVVKQLLEGLALMHAENYTHRDLKPSNIFIASPAPRWWLKIGDFGISKRITEDTALHTTKLYTRNYCAPEMRGFVRDRAETDSYSYTNAVDLWSIGIIAYEMLAKERPFPARKALESFYDEKTDFPADLLNKNNVSPEGIQFISSLLKPRPHLRPTAVEALQSPWLSEKEGAERTGASSAADSDEMEDTFESLPSSENEDENPLISAKTQESLKLGHTTSGEVLRENMIQARGNPLQAASKVLVSSAEDKKAAQSARGHAREARKALLGDLMEKAFAEVNSRQQTVVFAEPKPTNLAQKVLEIVKNKSQGNGKLQYHPPYVETENESESGSDSWTEGSIGHSDTRHANPKHSESASTRPENAKSRFEPLNDTQARTPPRDMDSDDQSQYSTEAVSGHQSYYPAVRIASPDSDSDSGWVSRDSTTAVTGFESRRNHVTEEIRDPLSSEGTVPLTAKALSEIDRAWPPLSNIPYGLSWDTRAVSGSEYRPIEGPDHSISIERKGRRTAKEPYSSPDVPTRSSDRYKRNPRVSYSNKEPKFFPADGYGLRTYSTREKAGTIPPSLSRSATIPPPSLSRSATIPPPRLSRSATLAYNPSDNRRESNPSRRPQLSRDATYLYAEDSEDEIPRPPSRPREIAGFRRSQTFAY